MQENRPKLNLYATQQSVSCWSCPEMMARGHSCPRPPLRLGVGDGLCSEWGDEPLEMVQPAQPALELQLHSTIHSTKTECVKMCLQYENRNKSRDISNSPIPTSQLCYGMLLRFDNTPAKCQLLSPPYTISDYQFVAENPQRLLWPVFNKVKFGNYKLKIYSM